MKLWPKQIEYVLWLEDRIRKGEEGLTEKCRDAGVTYLCGGVSLHHWRYDPGFKATFGSRDLDLVDARDNPDSIFEKLRIILRRLPQWMLPAGFSWHKHDTIGRLFNPETSSVITGEGGDDMGRGGRASVLFVDEAAFVPRAESIEKSTAGTTDCVQWISSANGMGNLFYRKRMSLLAREVPEGAAKPVFRFHWRDDPRKTEAWAKAKKASLEEATWASEYEIDYAASVEGICIPALWVQSAQELAALEPALKPSGKGIAGGDVGGGKAKSIIICRFGPVVLHSVERREPDTTETAYWMLDECKAKGVVTLNFDEVGIGAGVRSTLSKAKGYERIARVPINVGNPPSDRLWPAGTDEDGNEVFRTSEEMFGNLKAEIWWLARSAFQRTHEHVLALKGEKGARRYPISELVALDPKDTELAAELSVVKRFRNEKGKIVIETKEQLKKRNVPSPDRAEAFMLTFVEAPDDGISGIQIDTTSFSRDNPMRIDLGQT